MTFVAGVWEEGKLSLPFSWFSAQNVGMPRACPKSVCHFFQLALVLGACRVTEAHGWVSSRSECDANELQWAPKLVRWEAALWACAFSNLLTAPPALLHPHRQTSRGQTNLHALPLASLSAVLPAGET